MVWFEDWLTGTAAAASLMLWPLSSGTSEAPCHCYHGHRGDTIHSKACILGPRTEIAASKSSVQCLIVAEKVLDKQKS